DPGFDSDGLLVADTPLSQSRYSSPTDRDAFYQRVLQRVKELPGVESAGYTNFVPLAIEGGRSLTLPEGRPFPEPSDFIRMNSSNRAVSPGYLETLGVPLVAGRFIDARDSRDATPVAVINET